MKTRADFLRSLFGQPWGNGWKEVVREASRGQNVDSEHLLEIMPPLPEPNQKKDIAAHTEWFGQVATLLQSDDVTIEEGRAIQECMSLVRDLMKEVLKPRMN